LLIIDQLNQENKQTKKTQKTNHTLCGKFSGAFHVLVYIWYLLCWHLFFPDPSSTPCDAEVQQEATNSVNQKCCEYNWFAFLSHFQKLSPCFGV